MCKSFKLLAFLLVIFSMITLFACKKKDDITGGTGDIHVPPTERPGGHVCDISLHDVVIMQSCTADGMVRHTCVCGEGYTEIIPAVGHVFTEWEIGVEADCQRDGWEARRCLNCDFVDLREIYALDHHYSISETEIDGEIYDNYSCDSCSDSFSIPKGVMSEYASLESKRIYDCKEDFSFSIYSMEDEEYIRSNLKIIDEYYVGSSDEEIDYVLNNHGDGFWTVLPSGAYIPGDSYIVKRSGGVIIEESGLNSLGFVIEREESDIVEVSEDIIFLASLEKKNPGYYPYTLEYSENANTYWLTLGRVDGLNVGDIICVGEATSAEDFYSNFSAENTVGKIELIVHYPAEQIYHVLLSVPEFIEIFSKLDVNTSRLNSLENINVIEEEDFVAQVKSALYTSEDFINFLGASYATTTEFLSSRGADSPIKTFADFMDCINIDDENTEMPHLTDDGDLVAKVMIKGEIAIPVNVTSRGHTTEVGRVVISFTAYVNIDYMRIRLEVGSFTDGRGNDVSRFNVGCSQAINVGFTFEVMMDIDYSLTAYPYVVNLRTGYYHFENCVHVASMNEANKKFVTAEELFALINKGELDESKECGTCNPVNSMLTDTFIINKTSKTVHLPTCKHLQTVKESELALSGTYLGNLLLVGYKTCGSCKPDSAYTNSFSTKLQEKMEKGDFGYNIEDVKKVSDAAKSEDSKKKILVAELPFYIGPCRIDFEIYAYLNFKMDASFNYVYDATFYNDTGFELRGKKIIPYKFSSYEVNEETVNAMGSMELQIGALGIVKGYFVGFEKACYLSFNAEVGAYGYLAGVLSLDTVSMNDSYMAAYLEGGVLCNIYGQLKIPFFKLMTKDFYSGKHPIVQLGYQNVIHKFTDLPEFILLEDTKYNLNNDELMKVGTFDLLNMKEMVGRLFASGIEGRYTVEFYFADGSNCFIEDGFLYVIDPSVSFVDELFIKVTGHDEWDNFAFGNSKITLPEVSVPIIYDALPGMLSYRVGGDFEYYIVNGIGTYTDGALVIPAEYNGKPVKEIGANAFDNYQGITSVYIPGSVKDICNLAFYCCENIESIIISDGVEKLHQDAFCGCKNAGYIYIGNTVEHIGGGAFSSCEKVESIIIPDSVVEIDGTAFADCFMLKTVRIGKNVKGIGRHAFSQCYELSEVYVPISLLGMEDNVFYCCDKLANVYYAGTSAQWTQIYMDESIDEQLKNATIHYGVSY